MSPTLVVNAANLALGVVSGVLTARALAPEDRGTLIALVVWSTTLGTVANLGIPPSVIFHSGGDTNTAYAQTRHLTRFAVGLGVPLAIAMFGLAVFLARDSKTLLLATVATTLVPLAMVAQLAITPLLAGGRFGYWNAIRILPAAIYVAVSLCLVAAGHYNVVSGLVALSIANLLTCLAALSVARRLWEPTIDDTPVNALARWARKATVTGLPTLFRSRIDQLILAAVAAPSVLGVYAVAVSVAALADIVVVTVDQLAFPRFVARPELRVKARTWAMVSVALAAAALSPIAILGPRVIRAVYGADYAGAAGPLTILLGAAALRLGVAFLMAEGRALDGLTLVSACQIAGLVAAASSTPVLFHAWGIYGPAVAVLVGELTCILLLWVGLNPLRRRHGSTAPEIGAAIIP